MLIRSHYNGSDLKALVNSIPIDKIDGCTSTTIKCNGVKLSLTWHQAAAAYILKDKHGVKPSTLMYSIIFDPDSAYAKKWHPIYIELVKNIEQQFLFSKLTGQQQ